MKLWTFIICLAFTPVVYKIYILFRIERVADNYNFNLVRLFLRAMFWAFPVFQKKTNVQQKLLIRKANIATTVFWISTALIFLSMFLIYLINPSYFKHSS